jgi:hypothetical protein
MTCIFGSETTATVEGLWYEPKIITCWGVGRVYDRMEYVRERGSAKLTESPGWNTSDKDPCKYVKTGSEDRDVEYCRDFKSCKKIYLSKPEYLEAKYFISLEAS